VVVSLDVTISEPFPYLQRFGLLGGSDHGLGTRHRPWLSIVFSLSYDNTCRSSVCPVFWWWDEPESRNTSTPTSWAQGLAKQVTTQPDTSPHVHEAGISDGFLHYVWNVVPDRLGPGTNTVLYVHLELCLTVCAHLQNTSFRNTVPPLTPQLTLYHIHTRPTDRPAYM
jgi:hypothetical protein